MPARAMDESDQVDLRVAEKQRPAAHTRSSGGRDAAQAAVSAEAAGELAHSVALSAELLALAYPS